MPVALAVDLASLALYDIIIYADDSGSMESGDGERIEDLKLIVAKVAEVATLFDDDGIEVRSTHEMQQWLVMTPCYSPSCHAVHWRFALSVILHAGCGSICYQICAFVQQL